MCGLLRWSLSRYLEDVCDLALGILTLEQPKGRGLGAEEEQELEDRRRRLALTATHARRGAVYLLGQVMVGSGADLLVTLRGRLAEMKGRLERALESDADGVVRFHASRALEALEDLLWEQVQGSVDVDRVLAQRPIELLSRRLERMLDSE